jgi:HNH endonuclease
MVRTRIPDATRALVLLEAGYKCANPTCRHILTLELHHIVWVKDGGENEVDNLLALCPNCHSLHTHGHIPVQAIVTWKSLLIALNSSNRGTADLLLVLAADEERVCGAEDPSKVAPAFRFTGDGLPALSGLLTSGIVEITRRFSGAGLFGASMPSFEVRLTDKGRSLVQAWQLGKALGETPPPDPGGA